MYKVVGEEVYLFINVFTAVGENNQFMIVEKQKSNNSYTFNF